MNCKEIENNLIFYIDGELDKNLSDKIKVHLSHCKACNKLYVQMKADLDYLNNDKLNDKNPFFYNRLEQKLIKNVPNKKHNRHSTKEIFMQVMAYAAAIIIAIVIGVELGKDYQANNDIAVGDVEENIKSSDFQLFANSYNINTSTENVYELSVEEEP